MIAALLAALLAQADPTPFWMPPPPPAKKEAPPPKKKKPVQIQPLEMKEKKPAVEKRKPPPEPTWIEAPAHVAEPPRRPSHAPIEVEDRRAAGAPVRSEPPAREPVAPIRQPAPQAREPVAPVREPVVREPAPAARLPPPVPAPAPIAPPVEAGPEPVIVEPEPVVELRRWSLAATFGAWGLSRSDGGGRAWDLAYGVRFGCALFESVELEAQLTRAGGSSGSPFVNASATRNLAAFRAFWVLGSQYALLLGGGGGVALTQTQYSLLPSTDSGVAASVLDANALKSVIEITAGGRARFFRGLEARAEVSAVLRDGRLELLPLVGVGAAF
ncbi:MAG: hypothetical protein ACXWLM_07770 [Myxococcales bacterium]